MELKGRFRPCWDGMTMSDVMCKNNLLKLLIIRYEKEYLEKQGMTSCSPEERTKMRRAVTSRTKKEMNELSMLHKQIVDRIHEPSSIGWELKAFYKFVNEGD